MKLILRRQWCWLATAVIAFSVFGAFALQAQEVSAKRRVVERSVPAYPALARSMALAGTVRVEALVSPNGSVKTVAIRGGHPVLAQAAVNSVRTWKWEPASHESRETVELKFDPE